jgi:hypothetical protein
VDRVDYRTHPGKDNAMTESEIAANRGAGRGSEEDDRDRDAPGPFLGPLAGILGVSKRALAPCLPLLLVSSVLSQEPVNLVRNPSMERPAASEVAVAEDWQGDEAARVRGNVVADNANAHTGRSSIRLSTGPGPGSFVTCSGRSIRVKPRTTYFITWWCKTAYMTTARAYVWLQTNKAQRTLPDPDQSGTQGWTQHFGQYTTTEDETVLTPVLTTQQRAAAEGHAWFDDVGIFEGRFPADRGPQTLPAQR